jgi:hypothetical protein
VVSVGNEDERMLGKRQSFIQPSRFGSTDKISWRRETAREKFRRTEPFPQVWEDVKV